MMSDCIEPKLKQYPELYSHPVDILEHMFCVLGNGVDKHTFCEIRECSYEDDDGNTRFYTIGGYTLSAEMFENMEPVSLKSLYPFSDTERYQPFRAYKGINVEPNVEGIKAAAKYFIKCLKLTTPETMLVRMMDHDKVTGRDKFHSEEHNKAHIAQWYEPNLPKWKEAIPLIEEEFGL